MRARFLFCTLQISPDDHAIFNVYVPGPVFTKLSNASNGSAFFCILDFTVHGVAKRSCAIARINRAGYCVRKLAFHKDACIPLKPCGVVGSCIVGARGVLVMARAMRKECLYVKHRPVGISKPSRK